MTIATGERVRITLRDGNWLEGTVRTAENNAWPGTQDNWYIELDVDGGTCGNGYRYWKQGDENSLRLGLADGGTVEKVGADEDEDEDETTYCVVRRYRDTGERTIMAEGLTLEEAQEWCQNPETSSRTATSPEAEQHTAEHGPWFDGYEEE